MRISNQLAGGNIQLLSISGKEALLDVELRDTEGDWFYWMFRAEFPEEGVYRFRFVSPNRVGTRGPAFRRRGEVQWKWLHPEGYAETQEFSWLCREGGESVEFCMGMQYLAEDWERFLREMSSPELKSGILCRSGKGRNVEMANVGKEEAMFRVLLTSRHHAGEMMATHALEGILREVCAETPFGRDFRENVLLCAVPFVDKDGVEDGDQGKNRRPHDYARDYGPEPLYPEVRAVQKLVEEMKPDFVLDLHCPWIRGGNSNERPYLVGWPGEKSIRGGRLFGQRLEKEAPPETPFRQMDHIPFGTQWNNARNYQQGKPLPLWAQSFPFIRFAQSLEIPFANVGPRTVDHESMLLFGASIARAIRAVLEEDVG